MIARQTIGAILNFEASFQVSEPSPVVQPVLAPAVPGPDDLEETAWSPYFSRRQVPASAVDGGGRSGAGRVDFWLRLNGRLGDLSDPVEALTHNCWIAYMSDDLTAGTVFRTHPKAAHRPFEDVHGEFFGASLDHTMWFHHPLRADDWHLYDGSCHAFAGSRGLSICDVFAADGTHAATFAQEFLAREIAAMVSR